MKARAGKVFLVGAGPGDPGLITRKGAELIERADVIVVDDLVNPDLFQDKKSSSIIYVGKRGPGAPTGSSLRLSQQGINHLLVRLARRGRYVVRLKGGDPLLFGRGGEEMEALRKEKISFEVVPGVTSAIAAPAYAGIPITDRRWASQVTIVTGQESGDQENFDGVRWESISSQGTLIVLMGVSRWSRIQRQLLSQGWKKSLPVAAVEWGTTPQQRVLPTDLGNSLKEFKKRRLVAPSVIIIGEVARLGKSLAWLHDQKPLLGKRVVVTRAHHQGCSMINLLEERGASVIRCPSIAIEPLASSYLRRFVIDFKDNPRYAWIIFLSENGARTFGTLLGKMALPSSVRVCAVGPHTARAVEDLGWPVHKVAAEFNSVGVLKALGNIKGKMILVPRVHGGPSDLIRKLSKRGAIVQELATYQTVSGPMPSANLKRTIRESADAVTFTSASTVHNFFNFFTKAEAKAIFRKACALSIGAETTKALRQKGIKNIRQSKQATGQSMVDTLSS